MKLQKGTELDLKDLSTKANHKFQKCTSQITLMRSMMISNEPQILI